MILSVLGIDAGLANLGFSVVSFESDRGFDIDFSQTFKTKSSVPLSCRLHQIYKKTESVLDIYVPNIVCIEEFFSFGRISNGAHTSKAIGAIMSCCGSLNIEPFLYGSQVVKRAVTGFSRADKEMIRSEIMRVFGSTINLSSDHAYDSVAIAMTYFIKNHIGEEFLCKN